MIWQLFELATISWFKKRIVSQEWGSTVFITFTVFYQQTLEIYQTLVHQKKNVYTKNWWKHAKCTLLMFPEKFSKCFVNAYSCLSLQQQKWNYSVTPQVLV